MIINGLNFLYGIVYSFIETKRLETIDASALKGITSYLALILFSFTFNYFSFSFYPYTVNSTVGESMEPTIKNGKMLLIKTNNFYKLEYNYGDIITFKFQDSIFLKRIVAKPGDTIQVKDSYIMLNGVKMPKKMIGEFLVFKNDILTDLYEEKIYQFKYKIINYKKRLNQVNKNASYLDEGQYFVMGDNRDNSLDSRYFGSISEEQITGKVISFYLPFK